MRKTSESLIVELELTVSVEEGNRYNLSEEADMHSWMRSYQYARLSEGDGLLVACFTLEQSVRDNLKLFKNLLEIGGITETEFITAAKEMLSVNYGSLVDGAKLFYAIFPKASVFLWTPLPANAYTPERRNQIPDLPMTRGQEHIYRNFPSEIPYFPQLPSFYKREQKSKLEAIRDYEQSLHK